MSALPLKGDPAAFSHAGRMLSIRFGVVDPTLRTGQAAGCTAVEYSNASDPERQPPASRNARPAPTTLTDRLGASSHRGDQQRARARARVAIWVAVHHDLDGSLVCVHMV
jgi:hypothetical protein